MRRHETGADGGTLDATVAKACAGDREALETVARAVRPQVYALAMRFLWHPEDAEDATQEILIRVVTGLGTFGGRSAFRTWVYRVACNALLDVRRGRVEREVTGFREFGDDLDRGLDDRPAPEVETPEHVRLLEEVRIGCTLGMLLCLDRPHRLAYILGEILELDHRDAASALEIREATYRKRLSRARGELTRFMKARCGLFESGNACRCRKRVRPAVAIGRVDPEKPLFASGGVRAERFPEVLAEIRRLDELRRAAALYRAQASPEPRRAIAAWLRPLLVAAGFDDA